jgi:hypothetical protein
MNEMGFSAQSQKDKKQWYDFKKVGDKLKRARNTGIESTREKAAMPTSCLSTKIVVSSSRVGGDFATTNYKKLVRRNG